MLSRSNEQVFTSNNYRLIPASDKVIFQQYFNNCCSLSLSPNFEAILGNIVMFLVEWAKVYDES